MGKVILLILAALSTQVHAEDKLADILADRASNKNEDDALADLGEDLDMTTLAKGKAVGNKPAPPTPKPNGPAGGRFIPIQQAPKKQGRVLGGTNTLMSGGGKAAQETAPAVPSYWGGGDDEKGLGYGWSMGLGLKKSAKKKAYSREEYNPLSKGKFIPVVTPKPRTGRVLGGTNTLMSGAGKAAQESAPAIPSYWGGSDQDKGLGYGWSMGLKKKTKAQAEVPLTLPLAPNLRVARPQIMIIGNRPLLAGRPMIGR